MNITLNIRQLSGDLLTLTNVPRRLTVANLKKRIENHLTAENRAQWSDFVENGCIPLDSQQSVASFKHHSNTILHFGEFDSREDTESLNLHLPEAGVNYNAIESNKIYAVTGDLSALETQDYAMTSILPPPKKLLGSIIFFAIVGAAYGAVEAWNAHLELLDDNHTRAELAKAELANYMMTSCTAGAGTAVATGSLTSLFYRLCKRSLDFKTALDDPNDSEQTESSALLPRPATAPGNGGSIN